MLFKMGVQASTVCLCCSCWCVKWNSGSWAGLGPSLYLPPSDYFTPLIFLPPPLIWEDHWKERVRQRDGMGGGTEWPSSKIQRLRAEPEIPAALTSRVWKSLQMEAKPFLSKHVEVQKNEAVFDKRISITWSWEKVAFTAHYSFFLSQSYLCWPDSTEEIYSWVFEMFILFSSCSASLRQHVISRYLNHSSFSHKTDNMNIYAKWACQAMWWPVMGINIT